MGYFIFKLASAAKRPGLLRAYREAVSHQGWSEQELEAYQAEHLRRLIEFCATQVPYYQSIFAEKGIDWRSIRRPADLACIPTQTKAQIKGAADRIYPITRVPYSLGSTGGSTGEPLKYRMSIEDTNWAMALLFRGWGYGGYNMGDKVAVVAGGSISSKSFSIGTIVKDFIMNIDHYSTYGISDDDAVGFVKSIAKSRAKYIRGYATALYRIAITVERTGIGMPRLEAAFSTAEVLSDAYRRKIQSVLGVKVYDNYGLNDGGVSAYECGVGTGMHVDYERGILEVVNEQGEPISEGLGRILATSLRNTALPFVRYETGDWAVISNEPCPCGRAGPRLMAIRGRQTEELEMNGKTIASPVLTVLMGKTNVEEYRIRQVAPEHLVFDIVPGSGYGLEDRKLIENSIVTHLGNVEISFNEVTSIERSGDSKHKIIIKDF